MDELWWILTATRHAKWYVSISSKPWDTASLSHSKISLSNIAFRENPVKFREFFFSINVYTLYARMQYRLLPLGLLETFGNFLLNTWVELFTSKGNLISISHLCSLESFSFQILSAGSDLVTVDVGDCRVGLGICYDCRFPEMAQIYAQKGCHLLLYPGASNMTTGPLHWELLARSRANDNQASKVF